MSNMIGRKARGIRPPRCVTQLGLESLETRVLLSVNSAFQHEGSLSELGLSGDPGQALSTFVSPDLNSGISVFGDADYGSDLPDSLAAENLPLPTIVVVAFRLVDTTASQALESALADAFEASSRGERFYYSHLGAVLLSVLEDSPGAMSLQSPFSQNVVPIRYASADLSLNPPFIPRDTTRTSSLVTEATFLFSPDTLAAPRIPWGTLPMQTLQQSTVSRGEGGGDFVSWLPAAASAYRTELSLTEFGDADGEGGAPGERSPGAPEEWLALAWGGVGLPQNLEGGVELALFRGSPSSLSVIDGALMRPESTHHAADVILTDWLASRDDGLIELSAEELELAATDGVGEVVGEAGQDPAWRWADVVLELETQLEAMEAFEVLQEPVEAEPPTVDAPVAEEAIPVADRLGQQAAISVDGRTAAATLGVVATLVKGVSLPRTDIPAANRIASRLWRGRRRGG